MAITIKEIAKLAGVSTGTVDRALHDRGRVNSQLAEKIKKIAKENGFEPSRAAKALSISRNPIKIGVVVHLTKTEFMQQVVGGIEQAKLELSEMGCEVIIKKIRSLNLEEQLAAIDELLTLGIQGLALSPIDDSLVVEKINMVAEKGIPVITFNTDAKGSKRSCFVGMDDKQSGRAAAGLMNMLLPKNATVGIITGHITNYSNSDRVDGFVSEVQANFPHIAITGIQVCFDDDDKAEEITRQMVNSTYGVDGIFVAGGGQKGVCNALEKLQGINKIKVIAYDIVPATINGLNKNAIDFVIDQNARTQGQRPVYMLFEHLFSGEDIPKLPQYTDISIKTKYNILNT